MTEISAKPITPAQVRAIHVALHRHGIDDDEYRARLMDRWGVDTCKALTRREASDLIASLGYPLPNPPGGRAAAAAGTSAGTAGERSAVSDASAA